MSLDEWVAEVGRIKERGGGSVVDVAHALREYGERGGKKIGAANVLRKEYGLSIPQTLELLSWTEGGVTDDELLASVPLWSE